MYWVFALVYTLLAYYDARYTRIKISEFGVAVELNPAIRTLYSKIGAIGVDVGVVIPTIFIVYLGTFNSNILSFALGMRALLFLLQLRMNSARSQDS